MDHDAPANAVDAYVEAAARANTQRSYASALRHFEVEWGGHLPATPDSVARYLADHAGVLATNTLRHRLAALAGWHREHGFVDPTRAPLVRKVLKGIQALHPSVEKQAEPLLLARLAQVDDWLAGAILAAQNRGAGADALRHRRDRALILLGFWRGFRGDELIRVHVEHLRLVPGEGMTCFLPRSKGDRQARGNTYKVPALSRLCPVTATWDWITAATLTEGPVFRSVDRWGHVAENALHPNSLIPLLRRLFTVAGLPDADEYSGHSLRRGFAGWANANGWDVKALMEYVGWRDVHSAMRYIDGSDPFARHRIEANLPAPALQTMSP
ncbi:site-specific integrase [Xanthomonas euvesicatoria pv. allii]|nr:site-specific integrase [Xanthomonas euvesicatoria pv. allii]